MNPQKKKWLILGGLAAGVFFLLGFIGSSQVPRLRTWVMVKIEQESRDNLPVRVLPGSIDIDFLPLGTTLRNVRIFPKDELKSTLDPLEVKRVSVTVSLWQLIQGKIRLSSVEIEGTDVSARIKKSEKKAGKPLEGVFDALASIPISRLELDDVSVRLAIEDPNLVVAVENASLEFEKQRNGVSLLVDDASIRVRDPETKAAVLLNLEASLSASRDRVWVDALKVRRGDSYFIASGKGQGDVEDLNLRDLDFSVRSEVMLESMRAWTVKTFAHTDWAPGLPHLFGRAFIDGRVKREKGGRPAGDFKLRTEKLAIDEIGLGKVETSGSFKNDLFRLPKTTVDNGAGQIAITDLKVQLGPAITLDGHLKVGGLNVHELLNQLGAGRVAVFATIKADGPCTGQIEPQFFLDCKGTARGEKLLVQDGLEKSASTIVAIPEFDVNGGFRIADNVVKYVADVAMPNSKGKSDGEIGFKTGFKINFEGEKFAFKDIANLANLKIEGTGRVKGTTQGNSKAASVTLALDGNDLWFENYWLGNAKGQIGYKAGQLTFDNLTGNYSVSRYSGDLAVDIPNKKIAASLRLPFFDLKDLLKAFSRKVELGFPITGTGQANLKVSGPLQFNLLSYDLKSSIFRGSVLGETFDQANFDVKSVGGEVKTERVQMTKGGALITLSGVAHPDGNIETTVKGRGLHLEDTNMIAKSSFALSGIADFDMAMNGQVLSPDTDMRGTLSRTSLGDQSMPDSTFRLSFSKNYVAGGGDFLGDVVKGEFQIPFNQTGPFKLKMNVKDWNYAPIFMSLAGATARKDYEGILSASIDVSSSEGGFWNSTGTGRIEKFSLARGALKLQNENPLGFSMKAGQVQVQNFALSGDNIFLNVQESPNPTSKLDLAMNGKIDLGLLGIMTPFFEDLRGLLSFKLQLKGGDTPTRLLGSAFIEKGYLKFFDFPHAFEDLRADLLFNQQKVVINSVRTEFGGGRISAGGAMELLGPKNTPLSVTGTFDKVTLNVPDKIQTSGSGDFTFSGNGFPFLLKGNYVISDGLFSKQFTGDGSTDPGSVRRDAYLPDFLVEANFVPLLVDMNIDLSRGLQVKNDMMLGRALGNLTIKGNPAKPAISGSLTTDRDTKVIFRDTEFEIVNTNVQFNGSTDINPRLFVSARSRVDTYDINLVVQGNASKPELVLTSVPPLLEREIVSLLAFGATDTDLDKNITSQNQAQNTGLQVGTGIVKNNPLSAAIKERLGFDVQLSTGFDDSNATVQKIVASRQVNRDMNVSASYAMGKTPETEAKVRYRLNDRFSVIGNYRGRNTTETDVQQTLINTNPNRLGLDVEYKFEFK